MTALDFLKGLLKKSNPNVNFDDEKLKPLFSTEALATLELPEEFYKPIASELISVAEAKNNHQAIKNHYWGLALNPLDTTVDELVAEMGLNEDQKNALKLEKNSFAKVKLLSKQIQALEQGKANADKPDKKAWQDQIDQLNAQVKAEKEARTADKTAMENERKDMRLQYAQDAILAPHKTIYDTLNPSVKRASLKAVLTDQMREKKLKFDLDDHGNIVLMQADGTTYHENNEAVNASQFIEKTLANNKLLITTPAPGPAPTPNGPAPINNPGGGGKVNPLFAESIKKAIADVSQPMMATGA